MKEYKYYFISYSSKNEEIAKGVCQAAEKKGHTCFFAPRDIRPGKGYAGEIIQAIEKSDVLLLIMTQEAIESVQVLREINAAVSRNIVIVPLKFQEVKLSSDMQYYLGISQWIDMSQNRIEELWNENNKNIEAMKKERLEEKSKKRVKFSGVQVLPLEQLLSDGFTPYDVAMREMEIDYLCIPAEKYEMNEIIEGTLDEWAWGIEHVAYDSSCALIKNDEIIGYCDVYPVNDEDYMKLIHGNCIIRDDMMEVCGFGGEFSFYISMIAITPAEEGYANYFRMIDWLFSHFEHLRKIHVKIKKIGISVYSDMLEAFVLKLGFQYNGLNPANGKIYVTEYDTLIQTDAVHNRYSALDLWDA